ncbi:MAG: hypothetical protein WBM13_11245 [Bacteroidia bacterium]
MKNKIIIIGVALATLIAGCKKSETETAAPQNTGNANLQSLTVTIPSSQWDVIITGSQYAKQVSVTAITSDVVNKGSVEVFISTNGNAWEAFADSETRYSYSVGTITLIRNSMPTFDYQFKIVIITSTAIKTNPSTNWKNYNEVKNIM